MNTHRTLVSTALLLVLVLFGAACGSGNDALTTSASSASYDSSDSVEAAYDVADDAADEAMDEEMFVTSDESADFDQATADRVTAAKAVSTGSAANQAVGQLPDTGREIVYTADLALGTTDVTAATRDAIRAVEIRGGYLFAQDTAGGANGYSTLVFKVPPDQFQAVLSELGSVGSVRSQSVNAEDVTSVVVDLESRTNTAQASVLRLRDLLDGASNIDMIAQLENQLLERETSLEQLRGRLRVVRNQVDFATITVRVTELLNHPGVALQLASYQGHDGGFTCQDEPRASAADAGEAFTLCWIVTNVGDTPLVDIAVTDPSIAALSSELLVVDGDANRLEPGGLLVLAHEFETTESIRIRSKVDATPVGLDDASVGEPVMAVSRNLRLDIIHPDDGVPSFGEVLSSSWNALKIGAILIALVLVAAAPFVAIALPLGWLVLRMWRRKRANPSVAPPAAASAPPPPPPPPPGSEQNTEKEPTPVG